VRNKPNSRQAGWNGGDEGCCTNKPNSTLPAGRARATGVLYKQTQFPAGRPGAGGSSLASTAFRVQLYKQTQFPPGPGRSRPAGRGAKSKCAKQTQFPGGPGVPRPEGWGRRRVVQTKGASLILRNPSGVKIRDFEPVSRMCHADVRKSSPKMDCVSQPNALLVWKTASFACERLRKIKVAPFVCTKPGTTRPPSPVPSGPAGNWVCFASLVPPGRVVPQMSHPAQVWLCFAQLPRKGGEGGTPWPRCRVPEIGFVCTAYFQPTTGYRLPATSFWLCFARHPLSSPWFTVLKKGAQRSLVRLSQHLVTPAAAGSHASAI